MTMRTLTQIIESIPASDGAGVKLRRSLGIHRAPRGDTLRHDPFLMLDEFGTENPGDYIAGFPDHPHRGFETVTYMLDGHMRHEDHMGNRGELKSGAVQWMSAGRGIIHSEMPQQKEGRMRGFQLWVNLPAKEKMKPAQYRDIQPEEIPVVSLRNDDAKDDSAGRVKVIAGTLEANGQRTKGPIQGLTTELLYLDVELAPGAKFTQPIKADHNAFIYVYEGSLQVGPQDAAVILPAQSAGLLSAGGEIEVHTAQGNGQNTRFLVIAGRPLREPIVQYGPFVMNTRQEIEQAVRDYQDGRLATVG